MSFQLEELYFSVAILDFALAAVMLFEPVFLYHLGYSIQHIVLFYVWVYVAYFFLVPLGGKFVSLFGPERSIAISTIMLVGYYACLVLLPHHAGLFWIAPLFFTLQKTFYWPAYHTDFVMASDQGERGKEFSGLWSVSTLMNIFGPIAGGIVVASFGFNALFFGVIALIILSNIPLFVRPAEKKNLPFSIGQSYKMPFSKEHFRSTLAYLGLGEEFVMQFVWPVFIIVVVKNYVSLGGLIASATLFTALATLYIGKVIDRNQPRIALRWGTIATAILWFMRPWLKTPAPIFLSDTAGRTARNTTFVTMTAIGYERALKEQNIILRAVFYEQGFAIGKTFIGTLIIVGTLLLPPFTAAFVMAGLVSLLYLLF